MHADPEWVETAARLFCEEQMTDYRLARQRAGVLLGHPAHAQGPEAVLIEAAVIRYQALFGGAAYQARLRALREAALQALRWLQPFEPCLAGAAITGAISLAHRVQIHCFADSAETVDRHFHDHGIPFSEGERRYRDAQHRPWDVPLLQFETPQVGIDLAVFDWERPRRAPLSPVTGRPCRRLSADAVAALLATSAFGG
jgi:hypothetical protein